MSRNVKSQFVVCVTCVVVALGAASPAAAQSSAGMTGRVVSADGRPLPDVDVTVARGPWRARTDSAGEWRLVGLPIQTFRLQLRRIGFEPATRDVELTAAQPRARLTDTLQYTGVRLDPVVVSARRTLLPGTFARVESGISTVAFAEDIAKSDVRLFSDEGTLKWPPRLMTASLFTRGRPPYCPMVRALMVFVDGEPLPRGIPLGEWVDQRDIAAFEITRGPAAIHDERRRRAAGSWNGPPLDPRIGACPWVWLIWTKAFVGRRLAEPEL